MKRESMAEQLSCPHCESFREVELEERVEKITIKGREVSFRARFYRCLTCGGEFEAPGQLDSNLVTAGEAYARQFDSPSAEELVALRSTYGASQKAFGLILGFGKLTMNSYEQGAIPDSTNRLLLRLARNPVFFKAMYEINAGRTGATQRHRIETSKAFVSASAWTGLESLAAALTPIQRRKIVASAKAHGRTVLQEVTAYVSSAQSEDHSRPGASGSMASSSHSA
jgi:putative zinc finger/helix-turn-helix YgiT family protein